MQIFNILKRIFSITDYGETHHQLCILGLKLKFPKREFAIKRSQNPYHYYKKNNIDITALPPAEGQIRDIQLANLALLKELDYVCKENGLTYWLDFGTLLGAVRHKGFIPWDDDIDTAMLRDDYDKIIDAFKKSSRNSDIYADYVRSKKNPCQYFIKVRHRKCPHLFVDIFPYDYLGETLSHEEQLKKTLEIKNLRKELNKSCDYEMSNKRILSEIEQQKATYLKEPFKGSNLVWGLEFNHCWKNWIYDYDVIFPLSEISFEGHKFPCANKKEYFLEEVYDDYMAYPKKIGIGHSMYIKLSEQHKEVINKLIKD